MKKSGQIIVSGAEKILEYFTSWLKTPEERDLYSAQAERERSDALKIRYEISADAIKKVLETHSIGISNLEHIIELCERAGYTKKQIQDLVGTNVKKLIEMHQDFSILKELVRSGVIVDMKNHRINPAED